MLFCFHNCHWFILMTNGFLVIPAILKLTYKNFLFFFKTSSLSASLLVVAHNKIQPSCLLSSPSFFSFFLPPFFSPLCFNCCFLRADSSHWKNLTLSGTLRDRFEIWLEWPKLQPGSGWQGRTAGRCGRQAGRQAFLLLRRRVEEETSASCWDPALQRRSPCQLLPLRCAWILTQLSCIKAIPNSRP